MKYSSIDSFSDALVAVWFGEVCSNARKSERTSLMGVTINSLKHCEQILIAIINRAFKYVIVTNRLMSTIQTLC